MKKKVLPCKKCRSTDIELYDCGYSSFNAGHGKCLKCGYEVKCNNINDVEDVRKQWNYFNEKVTIIEAIRRLRKQLKQAGIEPCA
jgi:hypothetical protein